MNLLEYFAKKRTTRTLLQELLASHYDLQLALVSVNTQRRIGQRLADGLTVDQILVMKQAVLTGNFFGAANTRRWIEWIKAADIRLPQSEHVNFSGEGPTLQILRTNPVYRILESAFFYLSTTVDPRPKGGLHLSRISGIPSGALTFASSTSANHEFLFFLGPVYLADSLDHDMVGRQIEMYTEFGVLIEQFLSESERSRAKRYSRLRSVISKDDLYSRYTRLLGALETFSRVQIDDFEYESSILRKIGTLLLVDCSARESTGVKEYTIPYHSSEHVNASNTLRGHLLLRTTGSGGALQVQPLDEPMSRTNQSELTSYSRRISQISDQVYTNTVDQRLENILVYRGWVFDYMGEASGGDTGQHSRFMDYSYSKHEPGTVVERITCAWVSGLIRADAVTFYRFNHRTRQVKGVVSHATSEDTQTWAAQHIIHVEVPNKDDRSDTFHIHRACESGLPIFSNCGSEVSRCVAEHATGQYFTSDGMAAPGSIVVLPIIHGNRVFGALECINLSPFAFDDTSTLLLEEFSELLGKYFVAQANARLMDKVRASTGPQKWHRTVTRRFDDLAAAIADYFLAHSATIWLVDTYSDRRMVLEGAVNRDFGSGDASALIYLNLEDESSVTAKAAKSGQTIFGTIGREPFGDKWLQRVHRSHLADNGFNYIAIIPISDNNGKPIGALTVLSRFASFTQEWEPQFSFCAKTMAAVLADFRVIQRVFGDGLSETTHEILQVSKRISTAATKLTHAFKLQNKGVPETNLTLHLDDIVEFSSTLRVIAEIMSPASFVDAYSRADFLGSPMVHHYAKGMDIRPTRIRKIVNQELENCRGEVTSGGLTINAKWHHPEPEELSLDRRCTEIALRNVLSNAIKYGPVGTEIEVECEVEAGKRKVVLRVSSFGPQIEREEMMRLFERRFRGRAAIYSNTAGRGEGLYQASALMKAQGARMSHSQDSSKTFKDTVWQVFRLVFPY